MITAGIICEYNPIHRGHIRHIEMTRRVLGDGAAIVCVMSGNFVQRGDFAVFKKHARAEAAVLCGADLVVELPVYCTLSSAEGFACAGVYLLDRIGADFISFGSESGDISALRAAAKGIKTQKAEEIAREWLKKGLSYAAALQKAADSVLGENARLLREPNNLLGIEYIKAINEMNSKLRPITFKRDGAGHDSDTGCSASALRKRLLSGLTTWQYMPEEAVRVYEREIQYGRGPVSMKSCEAAILARLRQMKPEHFAALPGASEGFDKRVMRYALTEPTIADIAEKAKTKRYAMSRIRRMITCACLGITASDTVSTPEYIRALAMNKTGGRLLKQASEYSGLPVITKPAAVRTLPENARRLFDKEAAATDFYVLAFPEENRRGGGQEWTTSPRIIETARL